tara:strand:- start:331 stop:642 length:312 start_codon:yes stop_codon:yes gene_type:complete
MDIRVFAYIGGSIMALNMSPQVIQIIKTKKVEDINGMTLTMNVVGLSCYLCYGVVKQLYELFIPISISLCLSSIALILKIVLSKKDLKNQELYSIEEDVSMPS